MSWVYAGLGVSLTISVALGVYVFSEIKKTYDRRGTYTGRLLGLWFTM